MRARSPRLAGIDVSWRCDIPPSVKAAQQFADFVDGYVLEDPVLTAAREQAAELGISSVSRGEGAAPAFPRYAEFEDFDGRNWERHGASLQHLSQE